jgi:catechol 2,3-dioxygenase-like lactoylglutathione lyase family enzyme
VLAQLAGDPTGERSRKQGGSHDIWCSGRERFLTSPPLHLALVASDPEAVDAFHAAALASGGHDNGPPGLRERYNPHYYYAAFVIDPDGHNI